MNTTLAQPGNMGNPTPLEAFKSVLSGAARSLARDAEVEVGFTAEAPHTAGKTIKVPTPGRQLPIDQVALARGVADAQALKLRHHNPALHNRSAPGDADLAARLASLTPQQFRVLALVAQGLLNKQIADRLDVQERTIKAHLSAIFEKLGARNRTQASVILRELEISDPARQTGE